FSVEVATIRKPRAPHGRSTGALLDDAAPPGTSVARLVGRKEALMSIRYSIPLIAALAVFPAARLARADEDPAPTKTSCPTIHVHFATNSAELSSQDKAKLEGAADCLKEHRRLRVTVEGNADHRGTEAYNMDLGKRRANAVAQHLGERGVSQNQLQT